MTRYHAGSSRLATFAVNIRFLETFVWLAKLQNFRLTAEKLHTTQAAVSSRIASLEESFDVRLFDRNSRSATLTPAGRKMLAYAERIVRLGEEMRREVDDADADAGLIRIGVIESIVHSWFPALMALVRERYPRLEIEVTSDTTIRLANLLRGGEIELILQTDAIAGPDFTNLPLCEFPVRWVASPKLGLSGRTLDLVDLADFPIVSFSRHSGPHATLEQLFALAVERPARINCITSVAAMIRLVADGFGVAALPPAIIQRELREGTLQVLDVSAEFPALPLMATCRAHSHPLAARIADLARQAASEFEAALHAEPAPAAKTEAKPGASPKRGARKTGSAQTLSPAVNSGKPGRTLKSAQSKSRESKS